MKWFGASWGAPVCTEPDRVATPLGERCGHCDEPVVEGDYGLALPFAGGQEDPRTSIPYHHGCFMEAIGIKATYVHVLMSGFPLCGFSQALPRDWPDGHRWVSIAHPDQATCPGCKSKLPV